MIFLGQCKTRQKAVSVKPLSSNHGDRFRERVELLVAQIPKGHVMTYSNSKTKQHFLTAPKLLKNLLSRALYQWI
ncbi:hypothetical protein BH23PAT2_BH23PAT2_09030 [soil metagenome]